MTSEAYTPRKRGQRPNVGGIHDPMFQENFWPRVSKGHPKGCWHWEGYLYKGYGRIGYSTRGRVFAHRAAYELLVGPIPEGLTLDHLCCNTRCVNPDHLEPVTHAENGRRLWLRQNEGGLETYDEPDHARCAALSDELAEVRSALESSSDRARRRELKAARNRLVPIAAEAGLSERRIAASAGISFAYVNKLKRLHREGGA